MKKNYNELSILLNELNQRLSITDLMTAEEFCEVDSNLVTFDSPDDDQIVESTLSENGLIVSNEIENEIENEPEIPFITKNEGEIAFNTFKTYLQQLPSQSLDSLIFQQDLCSKTENSQQMYSNL